MQLLCLEMSGVLVNVATLISDKLTSSISVMKGAPKTTPPLDIFEVPCSKPVYVLRGTPILSGAVYEKLRCLLTR